MSYSSPRGPRVPDLSSWTAAASARPPAGMAAVLKSLFSYVDPTGGSLAELITQVVVGVGRRVRGKATDELGDKLWALVKERLTPAERDELLAEPDGADWARRVRQRIETLLAEDRRFAGQATGLLFGNGGFREALWQLPPDNPGFANRELEIEKIRGVLAPRAPSGARAWLRTQLFGRATGTASNVVEIVGPLAIGKTELAIHAAHGLLDQYPDGCFVVDLGGPLGRSDGITDGLVDLLRAQGTPVSELPETRELALRSYRSWFHNKRALVLIENAGSDGQVRLFLPPGGDCGAIVTGTRSVLGLGRERVCALSTFSRDAAYHMLRGLDCASGRWLDNDLNDARGAAARRVLSWCGWHPAAIACLAGWINQPSMLPASDAEIVADLSRSTGSSLDGILRGSKLGALMARQYAQISGAAPASARLIRLLGLLSVPYIDTDLAAALTGYGREQIEAELRRLVDYGVLRIDGPHYCMAPFYQRFAEGMAREVDSASDRRAALTRAFRHLLERDQSWPVAEGARMLDSIARVARERANWIAAVTRAFIEGLYELSWRLALGCASFFRANGYVAGWEAVAVWGLRAAERLEREDARLEALARSELSLAAAYEAQRSAADLATSYVVGLRRATELARYGLMCAEREEPDTARRCLAASAELASACDPRRWEGARSARTDELFALLEDDLDRLRERLDQARSS